MAKNTYKYNFKSKRGRSRKRKESLSQYRDKFWKANKDELISKMREAEDITEAQAKKYFNQMIKQVDKVSDTGRKLSNKQVVQKVMRKRIFKPQSEFYEEGLVSRLKEEKLITRVKDPKTGRFTKSIENVRYQGRVLIDGKQYSKYEITNAAGTFYAYEEYMKYQKKNTSGKVTAGKVFTSLESLGKV